jgi:hypothetical protein
MDAALGKGGMREDTCDQRAHGETRGASRGRRAPLDKQRAQVARASQILGGKIGPPMSKDNLT